MPFIDVKLVSGRTQEEKDQLMKALTDETSRILKLDPSKIRVVIHEYSPENWSIGGVKISGLMRQE